MKSEDIILSIFWFSQTGIGLLGNSFLICRFIFVFLSGHRMRPVDAIIAQLALANCLIFLSKGIPQTMTALGLMNFQGENICEIIFYFYKVARDLSLSMTCLLSGFQAITISPSNSNWSGLKSRAPKYLIPSSLFCWTSHLIFCIYIPWAIGRPRQNRNITEIQHYGYCSNEIPSGFHALLIAILLSFPDAMSLGLMVSASGCMVIFLCRHHKQVQQIHITCLSPRSCPEIRATKTILLLVSTFVFSYLLNCVLAVFMSLIKFPLWLIHISAFLGLCFPAVSPYVLISSDSQVPRYFYVLCGRKTPHFQPDNRFISPAQHGFLKAPVRGK
ncbi:vomeronasal type-1 receptor 4-like [Phascolarctos cinereus]|uniref:Vomeronasal type-1 receptor n=1 Tax=Phascolarctos cinereus TaxID=38626 RepID=A0A6P5IZG1_PHACI|nr:vomeronasal type-1 receptor 4-like [Phascolarctos cinereus]